MVHRVHVSATGVAPVVVAPAPVVAVGAGGSPVVTDAPRVRVVKVVKVVKVDKAEKKQKIQSQSNISGVKHI